MEPVLRQAERKYQESGSWEDLDRYNAILRRAGMDLVRPGGFLQRWADDLTTIIPPTGACKADIEAGHGHWATGVYFGSVVRDGALVDIQISIYDDEDFINIEYVAPSREGIFLNSPRCYLDLRIGVESFEARRELPWYTSSHSNVYGRRSPILSNRFINGQEIFEYGLNRALRCAKKLIPWTAAKLKREQNSHNLTEYLVARLALGREALDVRDPLLKETFESKWFKNTLYQFAREIEDYVEANGIVFYNEGGWPIKISPYGGYSLSMVLGYNDTVDLDEEIDSNLCGEQRGHAYDVLDRLAEILQDYDAEHTTQLYDLQEDEGWVGDNYELVEGPDPEEDYSNDVSFELTVTRELTVPYVLHLLRSFG